MVRSFLVASLALLVGVGLASAQTIDFQDRECSGTGSVAQGNVVQEDGYSITKREGESFAFTVFCTGSTRYPGSTALYNNTVNGLIKVTKDDGGSFAAVEIKAVALNGPAFVTLNFTGTKAGGGTVLHQVTTDGRGPTGGLETFAFPNTFTDLVSLEWTQQSPFHQFDDLVLSAGSFCVYKTKKSKAKGGCGACPAPGEDIRSDNACEDVGECVKKFKAVLACPDGGPGTCKVKGKRSACG